MKVKKVLACALALGLLTACGADKPEEQPAPASTAEVQEATEDVAEEPKEDASKELSLEDEWVVDGIAKLKINSVKQFDERNEYAEFEPAQGVLIDYTYENLGKDKDGLGLFLEPSAVIDGEGTMGEGYPASFDITYAKEAPIGAKVENAQATYGLKHESEEIKVVFSFYDNDSKEHKVTFKVPVEK